MASINVLNPDGSISVVDTSTLGVTDLSNVQVVTTLPTTFAVPLIVPASNGLRRVILAPSGLLRASDAPVIPGNYTMNGTEVMPILIGGVLYQITTAQIASVLAATISAATSAAAAAQTTANAALTAATAKKQLTKIGTTGNITVGGGLALLAGVTRSSATVSGVVSGEPLIAVPTTIPTGFDVGTVLASGTNTINLAIYNPSLTLGNSGTVVADIYAFR